eukprot:443236_1
MTIDCITIRSPIDNSNSDGPASIQCTSPYTLVSCGFESLLSTESAHFSGSYINGSTCYIRCETSDRGGYAFARCCNLSEYSVSCSTYKSAKSATNDDDQTFQGCTLQSESLTGCTAATYDDTTLDGGYPGTINEMYNGTVVNLTLNSGCVAQNSIGNGNGVYSYATCCQSHKYNTEVFQCVAVWSPPIFGSTIGNISCPSNDDDYFMTSCSAFGSHNNMNQWTVQTENRCIVRNGETRQSRLDQYGYAIAMCCRMRSNITSLPTTTSISTTSTSTTSTTTTTEVMTTENVNIGDGLNCEKLKLDLTINSNANCSLNKLIINNKTKFSNNIEHIVYQQ